MEKYIYSVTQFEKNGGNIAYLLVGVEVSILIGFSLAFLSLLLFFFAYESSSFPFLLKIFAIVAQLLAQL